MYTDVAVIFLKETRENSEDNYEIRKLNALDGVTLKHPESQFFQKRIDYFGNILISGQVAASLKTIDAIMSAVFPT